MTTQIKTSRRAVAAFLLGMAVVHGVEFWQQRAQLAAGYGDFSSFYTAGVMLRRGEGKLLYDRREQWKTQQEFASKVEIRKGPMPFIRPPFEALVFFPLACFSYPVALAIWTAVKIGLLWMSVRLLPRGHPFGCAYSRWMEVLVCLGFFPVFLDLLQGQDAIVLLAITAAALNRMQAGKDVVAGALLALGMFKFHIMAPIALVVWLAGRPRILAGFVPAVVVLAAISCAVSGASVLSVYPAYLLELNRQPDAGFVTVQSMPNLRGLLSMWVGRAPNPGPLHWLLLPAEVIALLLTAKFWRSRMRAGSGELALGYCLTLLVAIVTSYYARVYDMTLLIIPLLLLGGEFVSSSLVAREAAEPGLFGSGFAGARSAVICGLLLLICTPFYWALILRFDCPYLLSIPMIILALGVAKAMRTMEPQPRRTA